MVTIETLQRKIKGIHSYGNSPIVLYDKDTETKTTIEIRHIDTNKDRNKALVKNSVNPLGFLLYGDGEIETPSLQKELSAMSEKDKDLFLIDVFGVF